MASTASYISEELMVVWLLLIVAIVLQFVIQRRRFTWLPPSSSAMVLGIAAGVACRIGGLGQPLRFSPAAFFYGLLPPIVFQAGFGLKKRAFFANAGAILMFAVVGTFISALVFGFATYFLVLLGLVRRSHLAGSPFIECLAYGAAISSIDPVATLAVLADVEVPPLLYNLVFGESVLNDAVSIVLFHSLTDLADRPFGLSTLPAVLLRFAVLSVGSLAIGVGVALACAFVLRRFRTLEAVDSSGIDSTSYEIAIVVLGSYLAYLVAEVAGMSGIVALFFSGICHSHYTFYSASSHAQCNLQITLRQFFDFTSWLCELFVFAYLGLQVATGQHAFDLGLLLSGVPLAVASRACNIGLCSRLVNSWRTHKLPKALQRMLLAVGLRGAVAYGLVINLPRSDQPGQTGIPAIETAALFIVVVTTLGLGSATAPLLRHFGLEGKDDAALYGMAGDEGLGDATAALGGQPSRVEVEHASRAHDWFKALDETYLKPLFGGRQADGSSFRGTYAQDGSFFADSDSRSGTPQHPHHTTSGSGGGLNGAVPPSALGQQQQQRRGGFQRSSSGGGGGYQPVLIQMEAPGTEPSETVAGGGAGMDGGGGDGRQHVVAVLREAIAEEEASASASDSN